MFIRPTSRQPVSRTAPLAVSALLSPLNAERVPFPASFWFVPERLCLVGANVPSG